MKLTGQQKEILRDSILGAYPRKNDLTILLSDKMNLNLDAIAIGDNYEAVVFYLIRQLEADGSLKEFIEVVSTDKPNSPWVQEMIRKLPAEGQDSEPKLENPFLPILGAVTDLELLFNYKSIITEVFETLNSGGGVALVGSTGMGKTSLLKVIENQSEEKLFVKRKPIYFNLSDIQDDRDYYQAMKDLLGLPAKVEGYTFVQQVKRTSENFLLLLDGIEQLTWTGFTKPVRTQLRSLANDINPPLRLVVAATDNLTKLFADSGLDSPFEGICQEIILLAWTEDIMQQFITSRLAGTSVNFTEQERKIIMEQSQGNPRRLMQECHRMYIKYRSNFPP